MSEIVKRSATGFIYIALILSAIWFDTDAYNFLFVIFGIACLQEFKKMIQLKGYLVIILFLLIWWLFIYLLNDYASVIYKENAIKLLLALTLTTDLVLLRFVFNKKPIVFTRLQKYLLSLFYIGGGCLFLTMLPYYSNNFSKILIIGIFIIIWTNDTFAYLTGRALGKHKLYEVISPNKTVEGFIGGLCFAMLAAYLMFRFTNEMNLTNWMVLSFVIVIFGTIGDLLESKFKRIAGVKDSGDILPGHGGFLDRLDSLVFAAPFAYACIQFLNYVS